MGISRDLEDRLRRLEVLLAHVDTLADEIRKLQPLALIDFGSAIHGMRNITERVLRMVAEEKLGITLSETAGLDVMRKELRKSSPPVLPDHVHVHVEAFQKYANHRSHWRDTPATVEELAAAVQAFEPILLWFHEETSTPGARRLSQSSTRPSVATYPRSAAFLPTRDAITDYSHALIARLRRENGERDAMPVAIVETEARELPGIGPASREYGGPAPSLGDAVRAVRRELRVLAAKSRGGEAATAQLANIDRRSRRVRDVVRTLRRYDEPVVLLADPGGGKSTTLRQVAIELAAAELRNRNPRAVVFVRLGGYRSGFGEEPGPIVDLIAGAIGDIAPRADPTRFTEIQRAVTEMLRAGRLTVIFDGMDEMPRAPVPYARRVEALSEFATVEKRTKTLFACRINDFTTSFEHRQMLLAPFGERQMIEYVKSNVASSIKVGGLELMPKAFVAAMRGRPTLVDLIENPFLLTLVCRFVVRHRAWPAGRAAVLGDYLVHAHDLLAIRAASAQVNLPSRKDLERGWAAIAYFTLCREGGVYADPSEMRESLGEAVDAWVYAGCLAGLLTRDPSATGGVAISNLGERAEPPVRFAHHRLHEYFAALHVARERPALPWMTLFDLPRWQETFVNIAFLTDDAPASVALCDCLDSLDNVAPHEQRVAGDRILLAAEVLRASRPEAYPMLRERFSSAVRLLAKQGDPATQIKMLWACAIVPDEAFGDVIEHLEASETLLVQTHARTVLTGLDTTRKGMSDMLGSQMAQDLVARELLEHLPAYIRAASRPSARAQRPIVVRASALVAAGVAFVALWSAVPGVWLLWDRDGPPPASILLAYLVAVLLAALLHRSGAVARLFSYVLVFAGPYLFYLAVTMYRELGFELFFVPAIVVTGSALVLAEIISLGFGAAGIVVLGRGAHRRADRLLSIAWRDSRLVSSFGILAIVSGFGVLFGRATATPIAEHLDALPAANNTTGVQILPQFLGMVLPIVIFAAFGRASPLLLRPRAKRDSVASDWTSVSIVLRSLLVGLFASSIAYLLTTYAPLGLVRIVGGLFEIIGAVLGVGFAIVTPLAGLGFLVSWWRHRRRRRLLRRRARLSIHDWIVCSMEVQSGEHRLLLEGVTHRALGASAAEFLAALRDVSWAERLEEPTRSAYWHLVLETERAARQEGLSEEALTPPPQERPHA